MIDTNFGDFEFGAKWRSSLAVYYYLVPREETADDYPNSRIVYLKLTCSITGYNPSEDLSGAQQLREDSGALDDLQRSTWEVITSSGWSTQYWPCLGAIMQLAVYPSDREGASPDDYPYIMDFEPKKREMYEAVSEGGEYLSGSASKTEITKGSTSVTATELSASGGFSIGPIGGGASVSHSWSDTTINQNTTDTSREKRETLSKTTQSSQMYQLFNGYHLGSNRALFVIAPRPHTVSDQASTEFNLIAGERKLEGVQEVFVVVHMPHDLSGFCVQAGLDTGHEVTTSVAAHSYVARRYDDGAPTQRNGEEIPEPDPTPPPVEPPPPPSTPIRQLVITRRVVQSCGTFDENDRLNIQRIEGAGRPTVPPVVGEITYADTGAARSASYRLAKDASRNGRAKVADALNVVQSHVNRLMLARATSVGYEPRELVETDTFKSLVANAKRQDATPIQKVAEAGHLTEEDLKDLEARKIRTMSDLFAINMNEEDSIATAEIRRRVIDKLTAPSQQVE
ncbi:hypothetical protein AB0N24_04965 [Arthrobacter sp. NPDC093128]|uniref:hypothetical protein n=1 Tax=Arthrobacter sp. NPDC093128 TaxID=3154979 RepID=UPI00343B48DC